MNWQIMKKNSLWLGFILAILGTLIWTIRTLLLYISLQMTAQNIQEFISSSNYRQEKQVILTQMQHPFHQLAAHYQTQIWIASVLLAILLTLFFYYMVVFFRPHYSTKKGLSVMCLTITIILTFLIVSALFFQLPLQSYLENIQQTDLTFISKPTHFSFTPLEVHQKGLMVKFPSTDFALFQANSLSMHQWTFLLLGVTLLLFLVCMIWLVLVAVFFTPIRKKILNPTVAPKLTTLSLHPKHK